MKKTVETARLRTKGDDGTAANFPFINGEISGLEKWARETLAGKTGPFKRESAEWFADSIIRRIDKIYFLLDETTKDRTTKEAYKGQAVDRATWEAFRLGDFVHRMKLVVFVNKAERDKNILFGVMARVANQNRGKKRGKDQTRARMPEWTKWQAEADKIWKKHPTREIERVAKKIQKKFPDETVRTIRLRIKKPSM